MLSQYKHKPVPLLHKRAAQAKRTMQLLIDYEICTLTACHFAIEHYCVVVPKQLAN